MATLYSTASLNRSQHWLEAALQAVELVGTPCYVFDPELVADALQEIRNLSSAPALRVWLSLKTQPIRALLETWHAWGLGVEVVSAYEFEAALAVGFTGNRILVNGVAKHHWLRNCRVRELNVHFDSIREVTRLAGAASDLNWRVGLRCRVPNQRDPEDPAFCDQFGLTTPEVEVAVDHLTGAGIECQGLHFHIGGSVGSPVEYAIAIDHLMTICTGYGLQPRYFDIGGGLPVVVDPEADGSAQAGFDFTEFSRLLSSLKSIEEVWLENGRFMLARAGALVTRVLDRKDREECAYVICDGGRINHARLAAAHRHEILVFPSRPGQPRLTTICGPTSAGVDKLGRWMLPDSIQPDDVVVWLNAGAYHIPLETRFSTGVAPVVWHQGSSGVRVVRRRETAAEWWSQWV